MTDGALWVIGTPPIGLLGEVPIRWAVLAGLLSCLAVLALGSLAFTLGRALGSLLSANSSHQQPMDLEEAMHIDDSAHATEGGSSTAVGDDMALPLPSASPEEAVQYLNMYVVLSISPLLE